MKIALMFPGQGSQKIGMGKDIYDKYDFVKELFKKASKVCNIDFENLIFNSTEEELKQTEILQPAITLVNIAFFEVLKKEIGNFKYDFVLGHSLGEYTALYAAEVVDFENTMKLVKARGEFMAEAARNNPGSMIAVIKVSEELLSKIIEENDLYVNLANFNSPGQIIISGKTEDINKMKEILKEKGYKKIIPLKVSGAWHSPLMKEAQEKLKKFLKEVKFSDAKCPIISNVDAKPHIKGKEIKENLIKQVTASVQWVKSIEFLKEKDVDIFIECGPGNVLTGLVKRIDRNLKIYTFNNLRELDNIKKVF